MRSPLPEAFGDGVAAVFGADRVMVTTYARPSQPIKRWVKDWRPPSGMTDDKPEDNGLLYEAMMASVRRGVKDRPIASVTFVWMQGEADAMAGWGSVYEASFLRLIDQIEADLGVERVNFVVGRINEFWIDKPDGALMREVLRGLGESQAHGDWVDTDDLNRGVNPWGGYSFEDGHFPPAGYRVMGQRFARKACRLIDPEIALDHAVFDEVFFDSAKQIETHAAVGASVAGGGADARYDGGAAGLSVLTDGAFAALDHEAAGWIGFAPREAPYELVVDLGEVQAIESVAVHTLLSSKAKAVFPDRVVYALSEDGKSYAERRSRYHGIHFYEKRKLAAMRQAGIEPTGVLLLTEQRTRQGPARARTVRVTISTGDQWVFIDEIVVNPVGK